MSIRPSQIVKQFRALKQPIYLLDGEFTLVFCNKALEEWTGCEAEKLIGQRLRYHSPGSRLKHEIIAASLSPPPEVFQGERKRVLLTIDRITALSRRVAEFIPLQNEGVLVLVDPAEATAPIEEPTQQRQAAAELHQTLFSMRRRQAGRFRWDRMIGASPPMQRLRRLARLAVDSTASVLILGEPGVGKEYLASAIHYASENAGALIPLDCRLLDQEVIASTVLAFRKRYQREETAKRHTLLLKDADLFPVALTPLIVDFVSSNQPHQRLIATSPVPFDRWPHSQTLPSLLGTLLLEIPPLHDRKEEIPLLAQLFLEDRNAVETKQLAGFASESLDVLTSYRWPGNLDELEALVGEMHEKAKGPLVSVADLPMRLHDQQDAVLHAAPQDEPIQLESFLLEIERELIERALRRAKGNKSRAAELLGITRPRLYRRLEQFGMLDDIPWQPEAEGTSEVR